MMSMSAFAARALRRALAAVVVPAVLMAQDTGTLVGRVTSGGAPVSGATVVAVGTGRGAQTRADGTYRLTLPPGRYEIRARLVGYTSMRDSATITAGTTTLNFAMERAITTLEAVSTLGTRGEARTVIDAPAPIDVLSAAEIKATGRTETAQMIQAVAPSFNFPRTSIGDGTDAVRPATLRSLAPDQTLVLVNGKRRHNSALVNVNGFVGRGSAPVDLNAIPSGMIDHIEILRDGAAAQYGSDAIAGVINIVLKGATPGEARVTLGEAYSTYNRADDIAVTPWPNQVGERQARDGRVFHTAIDQGWSFSQNGFLHLGGELRDRGFTNRSLEDPRLQYFAGDTRVGTINHRQGDAAAHDLQGFWNGGTSFGTVDFYTFGGLSGRRAEAPGFFRRPSDDRTLRKLYPNGFLPMIHSDVADASAAAGVKGATSGWNWDLGTVYGGNQFGFTIKNSNNVSLGDTSTKTEFDAGKLRFRQSTTTLDVNRDLKGTLPFPVNVAAGAEFRADRYEIAAGEYDSWRNGGQPVRNPDGTIKTQVINGQTVPVLGAPGSQVFPGFKGDSGGKPGDAGSQSRSNTALYVDLSSDVTPRFLLDLAGRYENYSDFGSTTTGKLSTRFKVTETVSLRGAASTGFRAPSLMQEYFSSTATNFVGGVPFDIKTFPAGTREAQALGASPLKAEKSHNYSAGIAMEPIPALSFTFDYYYIAIDDRIVLSNNFTGAAAVAALANIGITGISGGRYFTNAIDTKTHGYDAILNYGLTFSNSSVLRVTAAYNRNRTRVTRVDTLPTNLSGLKSSLFDRVEQARIEAGNPENNLILSGNYSVNNFGLVLRTQRYGQVTSFGSAATNAYGPLDQVYAPKWVTDLSGSYTLNRLTLTVGADNIFDVYPDRNNNYGNLGTPFTSAENGGTANFGIFPYAGISPWGFNGRFIYTRLAVGL
jgi:iron complex outermembrane recepter protein